MNTVYAEDDAAMTEIFRKHMGRCPIADGVQSSKLLHSEDVVQRDKRNSHAATLRGYGVPVAVIADVLDVCEATISRNVPPPPFVGVRMQAKRQPSKQFVERSLRLHALRKDGMPVAEIAKNEGVSASRIYQILTKATS